MFSHLYQNTVLKKPKAIFILLIVGLEALQYIPYTYPVALAHASKRDETSLSNKRKSCNSCNLYVTF